MPMIGNGGNILKKKWQVAEWFKERMVTFQYFIYRWMGMGSYGIHLQN